MAKSFFGLTAPGRSIAFNDRLGLLFIKATAEELDNIERVMRVIQALNQTPPQIHIKARFIEVEQENNARRGFDWYLGSFTNGPIVANGGSTLLLAVPVSATNRPGSFPGNTTTSVIPASATDQQLTSGLRNTVPAPATATGILTDPNFRMTLHALESRPRTTILAEPECVTTSGRRTQMHATEIRTFLNGINPLALKPPGVSSNELFLTKQVECGPILDVVPYVLSDGYTINLTTTASVTEFLGYDKPTNSVTVYIDGKKQTVPVPLPKFRTQKISTVVNLWDNQTLVLGGSVTSATQITKEKVPLIADLPLVGRLFQSQTENSVENKLMVFVTATIVDPAGNRVHSDDELPFKPNTIPSQPKISSPSP
jgi:general secretion pathway protein D